MPRCSVPCLLLLGVLAGACVGDTPTAPVNLRAAKGGAGGGGSSDMTVTSVVADADASIAPMLQLRSDGLGAYQNSSSLSSIIQGIGAWVLDVKTPRNATRQVYLDFSQPVAGSGPNGGAPIALPSGLYQVRIISKCNAYGTTMQDLAPGGTTICPLHIAFDHDGVGYALQMNPQSGDADGSYAETEPARITCVTPASGAGSCTGWTLTPTGVLPDGTGLGNVAKLLRYQTSKGKTTKVEQGDFLFSFAIAVTRP